MAISSKKALEAAKVIVDFCNEQKGCQNCIFRLYGQEHWKCKYHEDTDVTGFKHCCLIDKTVRYNDFCSYGKPKGE